MFKAVLTIGGFTFLSRLCGFVRDILLGALLGAGPISEAFFVALRLPNLFRQLFAEGAFNAAFVPIFAGKLEMEGTRPAMDFAARVLGALALALTLITILAEIFMPQILKVFAPGFHSYPEKFSLAVQLCRISFPYLVFISMTALQTGILNSHRHFAHGASAPILLNLVLIATLFLIVPHFPNAIGPVLAWAVTLAGILQMIWMAFALHLRSLSLHMTFQPFASDVRRLMRRMIPGIMTGGINQINLTIATILASLQSGAVSYLYYADRLYQLPLALIGSAIGVALLPNLTRDLRANHLAKADYGFNRALEWGLLFSLPACFGLIAASYPLINVLYERGNFDSLTSYKTAYALAALASGLPAYVANKALSAGFLAREDTATPFKGAILAVLTDLAVSLSLFPWMGYVGVALGTSIAAWVNAGLLLYWLKQKKYFQADALLRKRTMRAFLFSAGMGGLVFILSFQKPMLAGAFLPRFGWLLFLIGIGVLFYGGALFVSKTVSLAELKRLRGKNP